MSKLSKESDALHASCMEVANKTSDPNAKEFSQAELEAFVKCSSQELLALINELTDHLLFRAFKTSGHMVWRCRSREQAAILSTLSEQERIVFINIEDSGINGVWVKRIKATTQIPPNEVQKAVGKLEKLGLVKGIRSVSNLAQRIYMLAHLAPSDKVTGGSFFDGGELDESMVDEMCNLIIFHVRSKSWVDSKRKVRRASSAIHIEDDQNAKAQKRKRAVESIENGDENTDGKQKNEVFIDETDSDNQPTHHGKAANGKKRKLDAGDIEEAGLPSKSRQREQTKTFQLAHPHGYKDYPTVKSILEFLQGCEALRENKRETLTTDEVGCLIDLLVWDDKLEKIRNGYRTVRGVQYSQSGGYEYEAHDDIAGNGLTEVPCGRCQLFDLCQEGTKVSAESCVYYSEWIQS